MRRSRNKVDGLTVIITVLIWIFSFIFETLTNFIKFLIIKLQKKSKEDIEKNISNQENNLFLEPLPETQEKNPNTSIQEPEKIISSLFEQQIESLFNELLKNSEQGNLINIDSWIFKINIVEEAWMNCNYDATRNALQRLAYNAHNENTPESLKNEFNKLMLLFADSDPFYLKVMQKVLPVIAENPNILQSSLSKQFPEFDIEQFRYVLYFAALNGDIIRTKKGRSYALNLPE